MVCRGRVERKILPEEALMFNSGVGNLSKIGGGGGLTIIDLPYFGDIFVYTCR